MRINNLQIRNIRNHEFSEFEFHPLINIFWGLNGAGKTSILESIAIGGLSKSFLPITDSIILRKDSSEYSIKITSTNDLSLPYFVNILFSKSSKKTISNSYSDNLYPKDIIGELPIVVLSPDLKEITFGSPQARRDLMDRILSQSSKIYLDNWLKLKKILKQRSTMLLNYTKYHTIDLQLYDLWTNYLIEISSEIIFRRSEFVQQFSEYFKDIYHTLSANSESVDIKYRAFDIKNLASKEIIQQQLIETAQKYREDELRRGVNLFGPQRDDLKFLINCGIAKDYASQGQHKSLLIAIKFAEFQFLKQILNETPVIILDDIFSELDSERIEQVLNLVKQHKAQTFISVNYIEFLKRIELNNEYKLFNIVNGKYTEGNTYEQ